MGVRWRVLAFSGHQNIIADVVQYHGGSIDTKIDGGT